MCILYHLETGSFLCYFPVCIRLALPLASRALPIPPSILPQEHREHRFTPLCSTFTWVVGFELRSSCLHGNHLPAKHSPIQYFYMFEKYRFTGYVIVELAVSFFEYSIYDLSPCIPRKISSHSVSALGSK